MKMMQIHLIMVAKGAQGRRQVWLLHFREQFTCILRLAGNRKIISNVISD